jgi:hypothetical protein
MLRRACRFEPLEVEALAVIFDDDPKLRVPALEQQAGALGFRVIGDVRQRLDRDAIDGILNGGSQPSSLEPALVKIQLDAMVRRPLFGVAPEGRHQPQLVEARRPHRDREVVQLAAQVIEHLLADIEARLILDSRLQGFEPERQCGDMLADLVVQLA